MIEITQEELIWLRDTVEELSKDFFNPVLANSAGRFDVMTAAGLQDMEATVMSELSEDHPNKRYYLLKIAKANELWAKYVALYPEDVKRIGLPLVEALKEGSKNVQ